MVLHAEYDDMGFAYMREKVISEYHSRNRRNVVHTKCRPYCLFNALTNPGDDPTQDLSKDLSYQELIHEMLNVSSAMLSNDFDGPPLPFAFQPKDRKTRYTGLSVNC